MMMPGFAPFIPDCHESLARTKRPCRSSSEYSPMYQTLPCLSWAYQSNVLSTGFPLVAVDLGLPPLRGAAPEAAWVRLARAAETEGAVLLLASPYRVSGFAAGAVVRMDRGRLTWMGGGAAPGVLVGTESRLSLEREVQGSPRRAEMLSLTAADSLLCLPAARGEGRGEGRFRASA